MYKYETHLHTNPVSLCASPKATVKESLLFYKSLGYDGVFITNHFIDGNLNMDRSRPYEEKLDFYFSDYEEGVKLGKEIGIKVFLGIELAYKGTDFLLYGLNKEWFLKHPEIQNMTKKEELTFYMQNNGLVVQAHPFREGGYIDHIRLFPSCVHGVEVYNANRTDFENKMAKIYAENYNLLELAGSDNHIASDQRKLGGLCSSVPITSEQDFINFLKNGDLQIFTLNLDETNK